MHSVQETNHKPAYALYMESFADLYEITKISQTILYPTHRRLDSHWKHKL